MFIKHNNTFIYILLEKQKKITDYKQGITFMTT